MILNLRIYGRIMRKILVLAAAAALASTPAMAEFWVTPTYSHMSSADLDGTNDKAKTSSYGIVGGNDYVTLGYKKTEYSFNDSDDLDLNLLYGDLHVSGGLTDSLGYFAGVGLTLGWEDDFNPSENYSLKPRAGLTYDFGNDWAISGGVDTNFNEVENYFQPILLVKYRQIGDYGLSAVLGTSNHVMYRFSDLIAVEGKVNGINREIYQLADKSKRGAARDGYFIERNIAANAGVVLTPASALTVKAGVEASFDREMKLYNKSGDLIGKRDVDPTYGFYLSGSVNF